jgi:hypothetical protein
MKELNRRDRDKNYDWKVRAESDEEVLKQAAQN